MGDKISKKTSENDKKENDIKNKWWRRYKKKEDKLQYLKEELIMDDHRLTTKELCLRYNTDPEKGLTSEKVEEVFSASGPNSLSPHKATSELYIFIKNMFGGFASLLWIGAFLCLIAYIIQVQSSDNYSKDNLYLGLALGCVVLMSGCFAYCQESRSYSIMESFQSLMPQLAAVIRDGVIQTVSAHHLVVGDLVQLKAGDQIPADLRIVACHGFKVDNSALTGESEGQPRHSDITTDQPMDAKNLAFFFTYCTEGTARGIVIRTGDRTVMGRIANLASSVDVGVTPLARELSYFVHVITAVAVTIGMIFFVIAFTLGHFWIDAVIFLIGVIVANVPEGLLVIVTVALTMAAKRMAKKNCLVKNLEAVETLGSTSIICSDKTGTLTQNRMTVAHIWLGDQIITTDWTQDSVERLQSYPNLKPFVLVASLCSKAEFLSNQESTPVMQRECVGDASDTAILKYVELLSKDVINTRKKHPIIYEIPFSSERKFHVTVHDGDDQNLLVCMKGAPEKIIETCTTVATTSGEVNVDQDFVSKFNDASYHLASSGERVLGLCMRQEARKEHSTKYDLQEEDANLPITGMKFVGLISMIDPPRVGVREAVHKCRTAGIKVMMVTGDHPITALSIAKQVGIITETCSQNIRQEIRHQLQKKSDRNDILQRTERKWITIDGAELQQMKENHLDDLLSNYDEIVFARTSPQQKLVIVESCQRTGHIVAVTGDGVNDSPALKKADIGIAMGISGSDVSKKTADMILLDDNFSSIITGIEEGRVIYDNLKKSIAYILTSNVSELTPFIMYICADIPLPLGTVTMLCIDLGTDMVPAISLAYEKCESDIMEQPPRGKSDKLVNSILILLVYGQIGMMESAAGFFTYFAIMAENGFWPMHLIGIRRQWESRGINDLRDSYNQDWTYNSRKSLELTCQTAFFVTIVITQWADLIIRKTRRTSIFQHGMRNHAMNFGLLFETGLAAFISYCPGLNTGLRTYPLKFHWWLFGIPFAVMIWSYDELRRWCIRRHPGGWVEQETYY